MVLLPKVEVWRGRFGLAKRASSCAECFEVGDRARRLRGRFERWSDEVGTDSGMFSDIVYVSVDERIDCSGSRELRGA